MEVGISGKLGSELRRHREFRHMLDEERKLLVKAKKQIRQRQQAPSGRF